MIGWCAEQLLPALGLCAVSGSRPATRSARDGLAILQLADLHRTILRGVSASLHLQKESQRDQAEVKGTRRKHDKCFGESKLHGVCPERPSPSFRSYAVEWTSLPACPGWPGGEEEDPSRPGTRRGAPRVTRFRSFSSRASVSRFFRSCLRCVLGYAYREEPSTRQIRLLRLISTDRASHGNRPQLASRPPTACPRTHAATPDAALYRCPEPSPSQRASRISCRPACPPSISDSTSACRLAAPSPPRSRADLPAMHCQ